MGESAKTRAVRLNDEHMKKIDKIRELLSPFAEGHSDVMRLAIDYLHGDVVRDASAVIQRLMKRNNKTGDF